MSTVPNRLYAARSPEGVELWIPESEMPGANAGVGDVVGPASSTANGFAVWSGTSGKLLKDSGTAQAQVLAVLDGSIFGIQDTTDIGDQIPTGDNWIGASGGNTRQFSLFGVVDYGAQNSYSLAYVDPNSSNYGYANQNFNLINHAANNALRSVAGFGADGNFDGTTVTNAHAYIYDNDGSKYLFTITCATGHAVLGISADDGVNMLQVDGTVKATGYKVGASAGIDFSGAVTNITVVKGIITAAS